jgi:transcriptional regulator with XRE-family HTH domain
VKLRSLRTQCGLTQEFVATRLGVTPQAIARWESGKNPVPTKYLRALATLLGTSVTELVATDSPGD